jgi:dolichol-phosphate mannosyltransferase
MMISVISPVYEAEEIVAELVKRISEELQPLTEKYEIILVEDGSKDNSWQEIQAACATDSRIKGMKLSKNFGQHYAITAGLEVCSGEVAIVMDCDLQDDPIYLKDLWHAYKEGYDIVYTQKIERKHSWFKNITAKTFNVIFNYLAENKEEEGHDNVGAYSLISRKVINAFLLFNDYRRHYLMILRWLGFSSTYISIEHQQRYSGKSTYRFSKLINHAIDGLTSQSDKILKGTALLGFTLSTLSFLAAFIIVVRALIDPFRPGWASLAVLILFVAGLIISSVGILGIYIGKTFEQTKQRPLYIVEKKVNL